MKMMQKIYTRKSLFGFTAALKTFRFQSEFSTWLFRITTNVCLTYKSRSKEHLKVSIDKDFDDEE